MIYVMSDIHGSRRRFDAVMEQIKLTDEDTLYILGDVTHRDIKKLSEAERESLFDWIDALPTELDITVNGRRYKLVHAMPKELFYLANLLLKYFSTVPLAILFLMTTHPSQFAASLNQIGVPYKFAYSVSLTLRYIPDVQEEFFTIRKAQEARGLDLSQKAGLVKRIRGNLQIVLPLIFSSLERIDTISTAMELRRFGRYKKRTWYVHKSLTKQDYLVIVSATLLLGISLELIYLNHGRFYNPWI